MRLKYGYYGPKATGLLNFNTAVLLCKAKRWTACSLKAEMAKIGTGSS